jgi:hypothetical protein
MPQLQHPSPTPPPGNPPILPPDPEKPIPLNDPPPPIPTPPDEEPPPVTEPPLTMRPRPGARHPHNASEAGASDRRLLRTDAQDPLLSGS